MKTQFDTILIIAGSGRNVGKTTIACQLIESEKEKNVYAVKITPHFHSITPGLIEIEKNDNWIIFEETNANTSKDTSRYLKSGAKKSYLIQVVDTGLETAFNQLLENLPKLNPIIIESAALIEIIKPGLSLFVSSGKNKNNLKDKNLNVVSDLTFTFDGKNFQPSPQKISFNKKWTLL
jgi:molybdopterin-guanine dinucleotide biosynthesis protein